MSHAVDQRLLECVAGGDPASVEFTRNMAEELVGARATIADLQKNAAIRTDVYEAKMREVNALRLQLARAREVIGLFANDAVNFSDKVPDSVRCGMGFSGISVGDFRTAACLHAELSADATAGGEER